MYTCTHSLFSLHLYLWFKSDAHVASQTGRHGARGVKIDGDKVLQLFTDSLQLAIVDTVGYVGQLETSAEHFTHLEIFKDYLCWLAEEGLTLYKKNHQIMQARV